MVIATVNETRPVDHALVQRLQREIGNKIHIYIENYRIQNFISQISSYIKIYAEHLRGILRQLSEHMNLHSVAAAGDVGGTVDVVALGEAKGECGGESLGKGLHWAASEDYPFHTNQVDRVNGGMPSRDVRVAFGGPGATSASSITGGVGNLVLALEATLNNEKVAMWIDCQTYSVNVFKVLT